MSLFGGSGSGDRYAVIIDVGSGSVLAAIVHSAPTKPYPTIVWSHREHAPLRNIDSLEQSAREVMTALVNVSMLLDSEGRSALRGYQPKARLTALQCNISAPWSYTVTKTINYKQEEPFVVTKELIAELTRSVQNNIENELHENETLQDLGLQVIARSTMDILANGYRVAHPSGNEAEQIVISHANVVAQQYLIDAIAEMREKLFVETECRKLSFMLMLFSIARELFPTVYDSCLVDVTYEATEIGIMRNGTLTYSTHTPFGSFSLAREIASITSVPLHEAFGYLHTEKPYAFMETLPKDQKEDVEQVFEAYTERLNTLFHETGDQLTIPRRIMVHTDLKSETLFSRLVERAAKRNIKTDPHVTQISNEIINQVYQATTEDAKQKIPTDTALLLSALFFHKQQFDDSIEYT